jgi:PAS domain S-box-containing protein
MKNESELVSLLNNSPLGIVISNDEGIIEEINTVAEAIFGYKSGELVGKPIECLMPGNLRNKHRGLRARYNANPYTRLMGNDLDLVGRKKHGELFPVEIGLSHTRQNDKLRIISYISDITTRKRNEQNRLTAIEIEKASSAREMKMAHQVQVSLLPKEIPQIPGWSLAVKWLPANEVGGDFYDLIERNDGAHDLVIADVTGKGIPAALFMAFASTVLRGSINETCPLEECITRTNQLICQDSRQGLYVTACLARINSENEGITYVNAGHNPPLHYSTREGQVFSLMPTGVPLGVEGDSYYTQHSVTLEPGDFIVFYTDGVTESTDPNGTAFGIERLKAMILNHRESSPEELVYVIEQRIVDFIGSAPLMDDTTIIVARRETES